MNTLKRSIVHQAKKVNSQVSHHRIELGALCVSAQFEIDSYLSSKINMIIPCMINMNFAQP